MRDRRDGFSRTRSLFLRARHGRGHLGNCGGTRYRPTGQTSPAYRGLAVAAAVSAPKISLHGVS